MSQIKFGLPLCIFLFFLSINAAAQITAPIVSDDFNQFSLDTTVWTFIDPVGDASLSMTGTNSGNAGLEISLPAGSDHDIWTAGNRAPRIMQMSGNTDFEIEVKFESLPSARYQLLGLLVEESAGHFLRFDFYSTNGAMYIFAASFVGGAPTVRSNRGIAAGAPLYMRVSRAGDSWTQSYSHDGVTWHSATTFTHILTVSSVGTFVGNASGGSSPAHTGVIDYFFNTASPIAGEDGSSAPESAPIITSIPDSATTAGSLYTYDINANGAPAPVYALISGPAGMSVDSLSGLLSWSVPDSGSFAVSVVASNSIAADTQSYTLLSNPLPQIPPSIVSTPVTAGTVGQSYSYDVDATGQPAPSYSLVSSPAGMSIEPVSGIISWVPSAAEAFSVTVNASSVAGTDQQTFVIDISSAQNASSIISDDFNAFSLDAALWTVIDPAGDGVVSMTGTNTPDAYVSLSVPGGTSHDIWSSGNEALRIMQSANDADFEIEVKFEQILSQKYQIEGILIEQDAANFLRFDFHSDGIGTKMFAASFSNLSSKIRGNISIASGNPLYMRIKRQGNTWTQSYSNDGTNWTVGTVFSFPMVVSSTGLFAANAGGNPPFTCLIDYFFNSSFPVVSEDGGIANQAPVLTFIGDRSMLAGDSLVVSLNASDPEGGSISISGSGIPPFGQLIDNGNGTGNLSFSPLPQDYGPYVIVVTAADSVGEIDSESFNLTVRETTPPSVVVSSPASGSTFTVLPELSVRFQDNVGIDRAFYQVDNCSGGWNEFWSYNSASADTTILWTIPTLPAGFHQLYFRVVDDYGNVNIDTCAYRWDCTLNVLFPPVISSAPDTAASVGTVYTHTVTSNAEPPATYSLLTAPMGMTIDSQSGVIDFLPDIGGSFNVTVEAANSEGADSMTYILIVETPPVPSTLVSDDFRVPQLDTSIWTFVNPVGDGTALINGTGTADARVDISVPAAVDHDVWRDGNNSSRLMQACNDVDFGAEVKFNSGVTLRTQMQGILVEQDSANFIRFDFLSDGSFTKIFVASFSSLLPTVRKNSVIPVTAPLYLRVQRNGQTWTCFYSSDGAIWTLAVSFNHPLSVSSVGVFVANASGLSSPAHTAEVDYFFNLDSPITPEDGNVNVAPVMAPIGDLRVDTAAVLIVGISASDANGDGLAFGATDLPAFASLSDNADNTGTLTVAPLAGDEGNYSVTIHVSDTGGLSDSESVVIQVRETALPQFSVLSPLSGQTYDSLPVVTVNFADNAGLDRAYYQIDGCGGNWVPLWSYNSLALDTTVSFLMPAVSSGTHTVNFKVLDDAQNTNADSCSLVWSFDYYPPTPPTFTSAPSTLAGLNSQYTYDASADGIPLPSFSLFTAPTGMTIDSVSGLVIWTPTIAGEYAVTVVASNTLGADSQSFSITVAGQNPVIDVWQGNVQQFGQLGTPQRWMNILGRVIDADGISSMSYTLNGSSALGLSLGPDNRRLASSGDFNIDIHLDSLATGANTVVITAVDGLGFQTIDTVIVNYSAGSTWALPYTIDWSTVGDVSSVSSIVDGQWEVQPGGVRPTVVDYDRLLAIGDTSWTDYEVTVPITVHSVSSTTGPLSGSPGLGVLMRWTGHTDSPVAGWQPKSGWEPFGAIGWWRWSGASSAMLQFSGTSASKSFLPAIGVTYMFKIRVESFTGQGPLYSLKAWPITQAEPAQWDLTHQASVGGASNGSFLLLAHHVDATFGNLTVNRIPPAPTNIQVSETENSATVTWTTNSPSRSEIVYGNSTAYELGAVTDTSLLVDHSITLTGLEASSEYHFRIASTDEYGNSDSSGDQTFFTSGPDLSGIVSDDFSSAVLDTSLWSVIDPLGDGTVGLTGTGTSDAILTLTVPVGVDHDVWSGGDKSFGLAQAANDENFEVEVKFESAVNLKTQMQGIIVKQDASNFIRFDFLSDGTDTRAFCATFTNLSPVLKANRVIASGNPLYLRVKRVADNWTFSYSHDALSWVTAATFTHPIVVTTVGPFVANASGANSPAHTAGFDYFFNTSSPILFEDSPSPPPAAKEDLVPDEFALEQNYPNPFNPSTEIAFSLPVESHVRLEVYNILGQVVTTLHNGRLNAGHHTIRWHGSDARGNSVASGVYFYVLLADGFQQSKKMLLLK